MRRMLLVKQEPSVSVLVFLRFKANAVTQFKIGRRRWFVPVSLTDLSRAEQVYHGEHLGVYQNAKADQTMYHKDELSKLFLESLDLKLSGDPKLIGMDKE